MSKLRLLRGKSYIRMYKVAILQNDSEMMRYSWADVRPMVSHLNYQFDSYDGNDILNLYPNLNSYDALIVATNACSDIKIKDSLHKNKDLIRAFLNSKKGIAIFYQTKKDSDEILDFLPEEFKLKTIRRTDDVRNGSIHVNDLNTQHPIANYPHKISPLSLQDFLLNNLHVKGLYWAFLKPDRRENYHVIFEDNSTEESRSLVLSTKEGSLFRIVASSIALDWQNYIPLWQNCIKYAVEGKTDIALLTKSSSSNYDYRYLASWIKASKIPAHEYKSDNLAAIDINFHTHSLYIVDPLFSEKEIREFIQNVKGFIDLGKAEVIFFKSNKVTKPYVSLVTETRNFQLIANNCIAWMKTQFPEDHGYFAKSFWNTLDVLTAFREFDVSTSPYEDRVLNEIEKHDKGGNYDGVLGASCAMFEVYHFFLGFENEKTLATLQWILENYSDKILFERATAIDLLKRYDCYIDNKVLDEFRNDVMDLIANGSLDSSRSEYMLFRYSQTLFSCGYYRESEIVAALFCKQQEHSGKWTNIAHIASFIELLIKIQIETRSKISEVEEFIFRGIEYLYDSYDPKSFSWKNDILATSKCLKTLKIFETGVSLPVDVVKNRITDERHRVGTLSAMMIANEQNLKLVNENIRLAALIEDLKAGDMKTKIKVDLYRKISLYSVLLLVLIFCFSALFVSIISENNLWGNTANLFLDFIKLNTSTILIGGVPIVLWITVLILNENGLIPDQTPVWFKNFIERIVPQPGLEVPKNKKSNGNL